MRYVQLLILVLLNLLAASAAAAPPHMVLFIADDLSWHDIGPYGNSDVHTPYLDRLAKESLVFRRAFAASPTCTPSRSAIYTGLYPVRNGAHANHSIINDGIATLPAVMSKLGYRVVLAGKSHIGPRGQFPFEYLDNSNVMPAGKNAVLWTDLNTARIDRLLAEHDRNRPLCLIVAAHSPHVFWLPNDGYDPQKIKLPPYLLDTPATRRAMCNYYTDVSHMDQQLGDVRASLAKHKYSDDTLLVFIADQGAQFPFAKWSLYDAGIRTPLIVHWPLKVAAGGSSDAMVTLIDLLPTFVEVAGGKAMENIDGRSFLAVISGKTKHHREEVFAAHTGDKEMNQAPMRAIRTSRYKYIVNLRHDIRYNTHISNGGENDGRGYWSSWLELAKSDTAAARVIERYHLKPPEELYDLEKDPWELKNIAGEAEHAKVLTELREKVQRWQVEQGEDLRRPLMPGDARGGDIKYAG
jgi:N-sulfoglucosamine sulfohydrolase